MNILDIDYRRKIIQAIKSPENESRKALSFKQAEIFNDRLFQYVREELRRHFDESTVNEMPIVSFINFPRRIVQQEASIYKSEPQRKYYVKGVEVNPELAKQIDTVYDKSRINIKHKRANEMFKLQQQTHVMYVPVEGKLVGRNLYAHQIDAIPSVKNPEKAMGYIISAFDREKFIDYKNTNAPTGEAGRSQIGTGQNNSSNTKVADKNDYKASLEYYTYWDEDYNFVFNGKGQIIDPDTREPLGSVSDEDILSPIPGIIPIIDISQEKDFEYFVRSGMAVTDFGVQYNAAMSDLWHIIRMQGYAIGVIKGPDGVIPQQMKLGPNLLIHLKTNPDENINASDISFEFVSPSPEINGTLTFLETLLMNFVSSRGLDPKEIATDGSKDYNSALERMLAMIEEFEASRDDFKVFDKVEHDAFEIIKAWIRNAPDQLDEEYQINIPEDAEIEAHFHEPEMVQTKSEKVEYWNKRLDNGTASRVDAIEAIDNIPRKSAIEKVREIDEGNFGGDSTGQEGLSGL